MEEKPWYKSKTIIGSLVMLAVVIARALGYDDIASVVDEQSAALTDNILQVAGAVAFFLTLWGRLTAKSKITL